MNNYFSVQIRKAIAKTNYHFNMALVVGAMFAIYVNLATFYKGLFRSNLFQFLISITCVVVMSKYLTTVYNAAVEYKKKTGGVTVKYINNRVKLCFLYAVLFTAEILFVAIIFYLLKP